MSRVLVVEDEESFSDALSYMLRKEGFEVSVAATGLRFPNGTVITPDGATLVVAETFGQRLTAFEIGADGTLANRRVWAELPGVVPDGIALEFFAPPGR